MTIYQIIVLMFALFAIGIDVWAIVAIVRAPGVRYRPLWIVASLVGFIGLGIDWSQADDVYLLFGIMVPVVSVFAVGGHLIVKTGFPIVAAVALVEMRRSKVR